MTAGGDKNNNSMMQPAAAGGPYLHTSVLPQASPLGKIAEVSANKYTTDQLSDIGNLKKGNSHDRSAGFATKESPKQPQIGQIQ